MNERLAAALRKVAEGLYEAADALFEGSDAPRAVSAAPGPVAQPLGNVIPEPPDFPPNDYEDIRVSPAAVESAALSRCPAHDRPWTVKAAGVSKAGKAYNSFFKCDGKDGDAFCNRKPVKAWADAHLAQLA